MRHVFSIFIVLTLESLSPTVAMMREKKPIINTQTQLLYEQAQKILYTPAQALTCFYATREILKKNPTINAHINADQDSILHCAIDAGNHTVAELLLEKGAPVDPVNKYNQRPLHLVNLSSKRPGAASLVNLLCSYGANVESKDKHGCTFLDTIVFVHVSPFPDLYSPAYQEAIRTLLAFGAQSAPLFNWARKKLNYIVKNSISQPEKENYLRYILSRAPSDSPEKKLLYWPIEEDNSIDSIVQIPKTNKSEARNMALLNAVKKRGNCITNNLNYIETLLANYASPSVFDETYKTPLHYAAQEGTPELTTLLLKFRASINVTDIQGHTPLYYTTRPTADDNPYTTITTDNTANAQLLLDAGANMYSEGRSLEKNDALFIRSMQHKLSNGQPSPPGKH